MKMLFICLLLRTGMLIPSDICQVMTEHQCNAEHAQ